ncbi:hypothetical protein ANCCEY_05572 [Ancylostoma ceylanicum]|uniref:Uncharacterized protein n=1 Tax=Ancylostoma ceylanicum TaxID=53326 RepID=A0A0D6LW01_9BILA|nr:hypothetical protein ANCCEY_05572 [Ancylostoma ceylanicum]
MLRFVVLCALVAIACSQQNSQNRLECGFSCTRQAQFRVSIDGVPTTATCNAKGADPSERCEGCCRARALAAGLSSMDSAGFPSNNGLECICCFFNSCR